MNVSALSGNKKALLDKVYTTQSSGDTPLRENLEEVGEYYACDSDNIYGTGENSPAEDPEDPATANGCPVFAAPAGTCQQNFTIVMTDGFWNGTDDPDADNADNDGSPATAPGPFDGASFADGYSDTLADVAMYYYERDLQDDLDDEVPTTTRDRNRYNGATDPFDTMHQHMATYTVGFGINGTLTSNPPNSEDAFAWTDPTAGDAQKIDDLRHAAWNGRGDFLSAADPDALTEAMEDIFSEIAAGTGAASSVAFNTQNLESGALVFRAFFDTTTNTGSLIAQDVSITGEISDTIRWSAAEKLDDKTGNSSDTRKIVSFNASTNAGIPFNWTSLNGNDNDATAVSQKGHLNLPIITGGDIATAPDPLGEDRLNYLRGQSGNEGDDASAGEFRPRPATAGKLGDIIHSSPVFVGKPPFSQRDTAPFPAATLADLYSTFVSSKTSRREIVYIGANDGMLHGFDANTGEEVFAYVPNLLFPELSALTDQDYTHQFFVDMSPAVNDVVITPADGTNQNTESWNTVLVGGLGAGGAGYFALNVTDPDELDTEAEAADNVLWEFTQADDVGVTADDNDLNLGISLRQPLIAMSNIAGTMGNRWVAIFGNGYNSASTDGDAELYILFLDGGIDGTWTRGTDFIKINTGKGKAESSDGTTPNGLGSVRGIDIDNNGTVDAVYAGDLQGNVYRFDLSGSSTGGWSLPTGNPLFTATYQGGATIQPFTNRPVVVKHPSESGYMVIAGTGSYFTDEDASSTAIQSIYGLWDDFSSPSDNVTSVSYSKLLEQTLANASSVSGFNVRTLTNNTIAANQWGTGNNRYQGWVIDLDVESGGSVEFPGERAVRNFLLRGNYVFVNTVIPKSDAACTVGPGGFEYAFNPFTGGSGANPAFDLNNDGNFDDSDNVGGTEGADNVVSGIRFDESTPTDSSFIGNKKVTQTSDKSIRSVGTNTGTSANVGRHSWREIEL
jgi:type IV pilus assembly protein PilY1